MSGSQQLILGTGAGGSGVANYIEDVFSTYLYTGNGTSQTITNGIDLSTKGGLVWIKTRSSNNHVLTDTARGITSLLNTNNSNAQQTVVSGDNVTAFNTNGFSLGIDRDVANPVNTNGVNFASWTFRKQPKFFDVVTYTGDGTSNRKINHSLGVMPAVIIVKRTDSSSNWSVYHHGAAGGGGSGQNTYRLNTTEAANNLFTVDRSSSTQFSVYATADLDSCNTNGGTYVAYLFASNAGGFGLTGTDNVITCGSLSGAGTTVNLGYEPQWILAKRTDTTGNWYIDDNMRGWPAAPGNDNPLLANTSGAEPTGFAGFANITSTGFTNNFNGDYIYIAIRRGPMKTPTSGTSVYNPVARTGTGTNPTVVTTNNNPDLLMSFPRTASPAAYGMCFWDKLRGISPMLQSATTGAEISTNTTRVLQGWLNTGYQAGADFIEGYLNYSGSTYVNYPITRAPGFFDVVCYTGTGSARTVNHNLGVVPELYIFKTRSNTNDWAVYGPYSGATKGFARLNTTAAYSTTVTPNGTSTTFDLGTSTLVNESAYTYVAYLFASCPGVSKVGSYTGTGTTLQIDCGFTGGARFVLIKRTDSTGDWYVWDSARGIVSGNDPYLLLNSTAAEVTSTDYVDTYSAGFEISSTAPAAINANGGTFIFLAIS